MASVNDRSSSQKIGSDAPDPLLGRVIDGRFTLLQRIGRGGMGLVYRAQQAPLERAVALKILVGSGDPDREAEFQRRFFREAATAAKLRHPNTITIFDYGSDVVDGQRYFFITMELLEGITLSRALAQGPLSPVRAVNIALQVCRALREAHRAGVVHRDLKPGNVMLIRQDDADDSERDFVKVLDFGLAKTFHGAGQSERGLTRAGTFLGSPRYVAPEQIEGRAVDQRTDIYSFGCVLYRMLTGRVPFDGETPIEIMMRHLDTEPAPVDVPGVPLRLAQLVTDCLAKRPDQRPVAMDVVIARLKVVRAELGGGSGAFVSHSGEGDAVREGEPLELPPPTPPPIPSSLSTPPRAAAEGSSSSMRSLSPSLAPSLPPSLSSSLAPPPPAEEMVGGLTLDESTRPTSVLRVGTARRLVLALLGMVLAAAAIVVVVGWGLEAGWLPPLLEKARLGLGAKAPTAEAEPEPWARGNPVDDTPGRAKQVTLRITSTPKGAEVVEATEWGSRPVGTTPLSLSWKTAPDGPVRRFVLSAPGFAPAKAVAAPPPAEAKPPYIMDLHVELERERPRKKRRR